LSDLRSCVNGLKIFHSWLVINFSVLEYKFELKFELKRV